MPMLPPAPANAGLAVVTGATGGVGSEVCRGLAARGFDVVVAARDAAKAADLVSEISAAGGKASFAPCDLSTAGGAAALAVALQERGRIDLLVNAAGSLGGSASETLTINAIAPAVLTIGLMQSLAASPSPRVVNVASSAHLRARYVEPTLLRRSLARDVDGRWWRRWRRRESEASKLESYAASKLALLHFSTLLRLALPTGGADLIVHDAHPGLVWTPLLRRAYGRRLANLLDATGLRRRITRSPAKGAATVLAAALAPSSTSAGGASGEGDAGGAIVPVPSAASTTAGDDGVPTDGRAASTYFVDGAPARDGRAQSAESLDLEAARLTWTEVLADAVLPATIAIDVSRKASTDKGKRELRFTNFAADKGFTVDKEGRVALEVGEDGRLEGRV